MFDHSLGVRNGLVIVGDGDEVVGKCRELAALFFEKGVGLLGGLYAFKALERAGCRHRSENLARKALVGACNLERLKSAISCWIFSAYFVRRAFTRIVKILANLSYVSMLKPALIALSW